MKSVSQQVPYYARIQIYARTAIKIIRGFIRKIFLRKSSGLLFIGKHVSIQNSQYISVGRNVKFEDYSEIQGLSTEYLTFGDNVTIGRGVMIRPSSYYGVGHIGVGVSIGANSSIGPGGFVGCAGMVKIGTNVMIGPSVMIIAENHVFSGQATSIKSQGVVQKGIHIEDDVWIGSNVTILDGVTIGKGSVIGAGTLVSKNVAPGTVNIDHRDRIARDRSGKEGMQK